MRLSGFLMPILLAAIIAMTGTARAVEEGAAEEHFLGSSTPVASADVGIYSQYIWRGIAFSKNSAVIQPSATVEYYGFSMNLWGNLDTAFPIDDKTKQNQWNETDFTVAYSRDVGPVGVGLGYIYYGLDTMDAAYDSQEVYLSLGLDVLLSPTLTTYREISYYEGWYLNFGVSHSFELTEGGVSLDLGASVGYLDVDGDVGYFDDGLVSAGVTIPIGDYVSVSPMVAYSFYLSGKAYDVLKGASLDEKADHIFGGAGFSISF